MVTRRAAALVALEDATIRAARDSAQTDGERALVDKLLEERERNTSAGETAP